MAADEEESILKEKAEKYHGSFKIWLHHLQPEDQQTNPRQTDPKNIARLLNVYRIEGCHRLKPQHRVPVLIAGDLVPSTDLSSGSEPRGFIDLAGTEVLVYLHGHHRLEAAKRFLQPSDAWWVADLYSEGD